MGKALLYGATFEAKEPIIPRKIRNPKNPTVR